MILIPTRDRSFRSAPRSRAITTLLALLLFESRGSAAIITTGNVTPDPSTTTNQTLYVGNTASGTMTVDGGSVVTSGTSYVGYTAGVTGTATITDAGSKWTFSTVNVGYGGTGNLTVSNGGALSGSISLGADDTGSGTLTVTGSGSTASGSFLDIGEWGFGTMNVTNGGKVTSTFGDLGTFGTGSATIDGVGSSWTMSSSLSMGFDGPATLTVQNGGTLSCGSASINQAADQQATLTVTGAQSVWNNGNSISIGSFSGNGLLNINQGATVNSGGDMSLGTITAANGVLSLDSGTLNTGGLLTRISDLHGTGTINTHGLVTDINLVFNQTNPFQQQFVFTDGGTQNITVNLDPSSAGSLGAGYRGQGSLTIADGLVVNSRNGLFGYQSGATGTGTVDGAGTKWKMTGNLTVGSSGTGVLTVKNGAAVEVAQITQTSASNSSNITFDNGRLSTRSLLAGTSQLLGTGTIDTRGIVTDFAIVLDATHPFQQQFVLNGLPNQNVTINLGIDGTSIMGAGYRGVGSLTVADGKVLTSGNGYLGYGSGSTGTGLVTGAGSKWTIGGSLLVGLSGTGNLTIADGATVTSADGQLSRGKVTVTGSGSLWTNTSSMSVGAFGGSGLAELLVSNGGKVSSLAAPFGIRRSGIGVDALSNGKTTIEGAGSFWEHTGSLTVGGDGTGNLTISSGGKVTSAGGVLGSGFSMGSSAVTITGAGSIWQDNGSMSVGAGRPATLTVSSGGSLASTSGNIGGGNGFNVTSTATITGAGSTWTNSGALTIGSGTTGNLMVSAGGAVFNSTGIIGGGFGSFGSGSATVTGAGSTWTNTGPLTVGSDQVGSLTVSAGGAVFSTTGAIGEYFSPTTPSTVNVSGTGSAWTMSGPLAVGGYFLTTGTAVSAGAGTLTIGTGGAAQTAGDTTIFFNGRINLQGGTLTTNAVKFQGATTTAFNWTAGTLHVGMYIGNLTNSAGTLSPGLSPGMTTITGSYTQQSAATLQIEIGGTTIATQYDSVSVTGATTLGGSLKLSMLNGFYANSSDIFTVLSSTGALSGTFSNISSGQRLQTTDGVGSFLVYYGTGSIFNTRQVVLTGFQANPVPEPGSVAMLGLCVFSMLCARRKRYGAFHSCRTCPV